MQAKQGHHKPGIFVGRGQPIRPPDIDDLVGQLHELGENAAASASKRSSFRLIVINRVRHALSHLKTRQQGPNPEGRGKRKAANGHVGATCIKRPHRQPAGPQESQTDNPDRPSRACPAPVPPRHDPHRGQSPDRARTAHRACCPPPSAQSSRQRRHIEGIRLGLQNVRKMTGNCHRRHLLQIELQAAREHGDRNFLRIGRRQNELDVLRRLFQASSASR
jgi:hypothetical protein